MQGYEALVHEAAWISASSSAGITSSSFSVSLSEQVYMCYVREQTLQVVPMSTKDNEQKTRGTYQFSMMILNHQFPGQQTQVSKMKTIQKRVFLIFKDSLFMIVYCASV